jgi:hypothetical protein
MQLHHLDRIESHNQLSNLEIAHQVCNNVENQKYRQAVLKAEREVAQRLSSPTLVRESERGSTVAGGSHTYESDNAQGQEWSSREGEKHDVMRAKWDSWIMDNVNGPFKNRRIFLLFKELSYMAPRALGMGSSVTYRRYIMEDHYGGILQVFIDEKDGLRKVKLRVEPETEKVN